MQDRELVGKALGLSQPWFVDSVQLDMKNNYNNKKKLAKLIYFAKYHNRKISIDDLNCPDLAINTKF